MEQKKGKYVVLVNGKIMQRTNNWSKAMICLKKHSSSKNESQKILNLEAFKRVH